MNFIQYFLTFFLFTMLVFNSFHAYAQSMEKVHSSAAEYRQILINEYKSSRTEKAILSDLSEEQSRRYPNKRRVVDLEKELIANGAANTDVWLDLMSDIARYRSWWREDEYYFSRHLPDNPDFWNPNMNQTIIVGLNALAAAKDPNEIRMAYEELFTFLKLINRHHQAGKGGYKLFWLERELAKEALEEDVLGLNSLAHDQLKELEVLLKQKIIKHEQKVNGANPQLCLHFRLPLKQHSVKYEDFLRIDPLIKPVVIPQENKQLCITGFEYATDYKITVLPGVSSTLDFTRDMKEAYERTLNFGDREPALRFNSGDYILSRQSMDGIPLETVNADKVEIRIAKAITERALPHSARVLNQNIRTYTFNNYYNVSGEPIWRGEMDIANISNQNVITYFPIEKALPEPEPGVYAIEASYKTDDNKQYSSSQYFIVTDIGLTTLSAENGLYVFARSLETAKPVANIKLNLISKNNTILATGETDEKGVYKFSGALIKGAAGLAPMLVTAEHGTDFALVRMDKPAHDLSDRGVAGRNYPGPVDTFVYTDRGVYRPGESMNIVALARDDQGRALNETPIKIEIKRPDGVIYLDKTFTETKLGGIHLVVDLPPNARTGSWSVTLFSDPDEPITGQTSFRVEEYVPPRIKASLDIKVDDLRPDKDYEFTIQGDYFYGAPASKLKTTAEVVIQRDNTPFKEFDKYKFGLEQEIFSPKRFAVNSPHTDEDGKSIMKINVSAENLTDISVPLKARIRASVFERGGRPVSAYIDRPLRHKQVYMGIREIHEEGNQGHNSPKKFEIIALNANGKRIELKNVEYKLVYEKYFYNWYSSSKGWRHERQYHDELITKGVISVEADKPQIITTDANSHWWRQRVEIYHHQTGSVTSMRLQGYWGDADQDTPDTIKVSSTTEDVKIGKTAKILIKPPFAGEAVVVIANNKVLSVQQVHVPADGATIPVTIDEDWGAGVYAMVSLFRPASERTPHQSGARAIGLQWISVDREAEKLSVSFDTPEKIISRKTLNLPIQVHGLNVGEKAFVTIAAVDEGILQLTNFATPEPHKFYFGQRKLGIGIRDLYSKLIQGKEGAVGKIRSGGCATKQSQTGQSFKPETYIKSVALFSGIVSVDEQGKALIPLDIPDFNGRLRLIAIAYSSTKIGSGEEDLIVRDPVILQGSLPRFLAPEDMTTLTLRLQNMDGPIGEYKLLPSAEGTISIKTPQDISFHLDRKEEYVAKIPITTLPKVGNAKVKVNLEGPEGYKIAKEWAFDVRPTQILNTKNLLAKITPEDSYTPASLAGTYWPGTITASATLSQRKELNVKALIDALKRYPYYCTEQLVSVASPLLYLEDLNKIWSIEQQDDIDLIKIRVQASVERVINNMRSDGSFGYWSWNDVLTNRVWLSAYATEFLLRAHEQGYKISESSLKRAVAYLRRNISNPGKNDERRAAASYALYVLAKANEIDVGKVRYFYDQLGNDLKNNWALGMVASSLAHLGEKERAKEAFNKAVNLVEKSETYRYWYYGSKLRNMAVLLSLMAENPELSLETDDLLDELIAAYEDKKYFSTQEMVWLTHAAMNLRPNKSRKMIFTINQVEPIETEKPYSFQLAENADDINDTEVTNLGKDTLFMRLSLLASPRETLPAEEKGYEIERRYYTIDGKPALEDRKIKQNTLLVAVIEGKSGGYRNRSNEHLVVDLLPSGFELENADLAGGKSTGELSWLLREENMTKLTHKELRDDRFVASWRGYNKNKFRIAYLIRAVTPGTYAHPAVYIEDMYHPGVYGRGEAGTITIVENDE